MSWFRKEVQSKPNETWKQIDRIALLLNVEPNNEKASKGVALKGHSGLYPIDDLMKAFADKIERIS